MLQAATLSPSDTNLLLCSKGGMTDIHRLCAQPVKVHVMTLDSSALVHVIARSLTPNIMTCILEAHIPCLAVVLHLLLWVSGPLRNRPDDSSACSINFQQSVQVTNIVSARKWPMTMTPARMQAIM